ncbi:unnamed protein product [Aureobasidium pullulans]|nr:unnamed protein product [Aureobasidium pullulans]
MAVSIASSDSGNSSDSGASSIHSERKEVNQNGSRKRRRLSPIGSGSEDSDSEVEQQKLPSKLQPAFNPPLKRSPVSRPNKPDQPPHLNQPQQRSPPVSQQPKQEAQNLISRT